MLTDSPPQPHLPYTEQERGTEEGQDAAADGWPEHRVWRGGFFRRAQLLPLTFLHSNPAAAVPSLCARKITPPRGSGVLPKEERKDLRCSASCDMPQQRLGGADESRHDWMQLCSPLLSSQLSQLLFARSASAADERCTCCAHSEQAQILIIPPPPFLCSLRPSP